MELVHVVSRGVDKRTIFQNNRDYLRFINNLYELNDVNPVENSGYFLSSRSRSSQSIDIVSRYGSREPKDPLVTVHAFCLMANHFHLLLSAVVENGVSCFMKKLNIAYAKYFNIKNEREGALFQGRYKSVRIIREAHFIHIPYYIHCNPLDIFAPQWRDRGEMPLEKAMQFLKEYRWSSHRDYLGENNFPLVTQREFLLDYFGGSKGYEQAMREWLGSFRSLGKDFELE